MLNYTPNHMRSRIAKNIFKDHKPGILFRQLIFEMQNKIQIHIICFTLFYLNQFCTYKFRTKTINTIIKLKSQNNKYF